jgi:hypothetical protein
VLLPPKHDKGVRREEERGRRKERGKKKKALAEGETTCLFQN